MAHFCGKSCMSSFVVIWIWFGNNDCEFSFVGSLEQKLLNAQRRWMGQDNLIWMDVLLSISGYLLVDLFDLIDDLFYARDYFSSQILCGRYVELCLKWDWSKNGPIRRIVVSASLILPSSFKSHFFSNVGVINAYISRCSCQRSTISFVISTSKTQRQNWYYHIRSRRLCCCRMSYSSG